MLIVGDNDEVIQTTTSSKELDKNQTQNDDVVFGGRGRNSAHVQRTYVTSR